MSKSRSGLVPSPKKTLTWKRISKHKDNLEANDSIKPAILSIRPLSNLFNPYAKGCSVLCNHPAPNAVRSIINQVKTNLSLEAKHLSGYQEIADNIPEDLMRRYAETDSRPISPSPTITSIRTKTSAGSYLNPRRCITPELGNVEQHKRKKIILDLRRSHSQETLYWKAPSEVSQGILADSEVTTAGDEVKRQSSQKSTEKTKVSTVVQPEENQEIKKEPEAPACINDKILEEDNVRRGKKRKKMKQHTVTTTFHLSDDPETQVATIGPDSVNPSTRPSLIPTNLSLFPKEKRESESVLLKDSFLTNEAFQVLKSNLSADLIENTFGTYLNRAFREAYRFMPLKEEVEETADNDEKQQHPESNLKTTPLTAEKIIPRKFSKSTTRFEVPMNLKLLKEMTPLNYLSKYVWVSDQRKGLFKKSFAKYLITDNQMLNIGASESGAKSQDYVERKMSLKYFGQALCDALEFYGTQEVVEGISELLMIEEHKNIEINFRTWCGIVAFSERYVVHDDAEGTDSCDELEKVDFNSMTRCARYYDVSENIQKIFDVIIKCHFYD